MESVIATCIGYLANKYLLFSSNHFGDLKKKSTFDALLTLQEKIYQVQRNKKILLFVTFDIKDVFNRIALKVLVN